MAVFALMISGKIKNLFVLVSTPALFYYASQLVAEALQLPGQMRWYQLHGGSIRNFKDFFVIAGYFLILTGMEGVIFVRVVKRRAQKITRTAAPTMPKKQWTSSMERASRKRRSSSR